MVESVFHRKDKRMRRRSFLHNLALATTGATAALTTGSAGAETSAAVPMAAPPEIKNDRIRKSFELRVETALKDALNGPAVNVNNGDLDRYGDKAGTYTKALPHDAYGRVDPTAFAAFMAALKSGNPNDFEKIPMGGTRTLNGPQGAYCFDLEVMDPVQFGQPQVPPAPKVASDQTATELVEHYWGALLRDVPFTEYASNLLVAQAAAEMSSIPGYTGPRDAHGRVTPNLLFRGAFPGEPVGPYVSQFLLQPTFFGSQPITQQQWTYLPGFDYVTDFASWLDVQNGVDTGQRNQMDAQYRYRRNGRDLASLTHMDVLFQEYLTACLVLASINPVAPGGFGFGGAPLNPGNPYGTSKTQNGFGTFGPPDIGASIEEVACKALNAVWWQKWMVHLRPRPEAIGGIVHLLKTGQQNRTDVRLSNVVLNSDAVQKTYKQYGTYLLPQAFPEGSPAHPSYPTGHGTVAGACTTVLKFFYDGNFVLPNPVVPTSDGLSLVPYTGADASQLTVNAELNKLGHNVTFGHGIHAGIHWRSDSDTSLLFGEAVAINFLRNKARMYNEPFTVQLTKFDGSTVTISNRA
jgi:hypothetical protein